MIFHHQASMILRKELKTCLIPMAKFLFAIRYLSRKQAGLRSRLRLAVKQSFSVFVFFVSFVVLYLAAAMPRWVTYAYRIETRWECLPSRFSFNESINISFAGWKICLTFERFSLTPFPEAMPADRFSRKVFLQQDAYDPHSRHTECHRLE